MNRCKQFQAAEQRPPMLLDGGRTEERGEEEKRRRGFEALRQQQGNFHNSRRFRWRRLLHRLHGSQTCVRSLGEWRARRRGVVERGGGNGCKVAKAYGKRIITWEGGLKGKKGKHD